MFRPSRINEQHFGSPITPDDLMMPAFTFPMGNYYRPWKTSSQATMKDMGSTLTNDRNKFQISLDVQQFRPEEITVKTANGEIIIEGKHEERQDEHGFISRQFIRRYILPEYCNAEDIISSLTADGVLIVTATKKREEEEFKTVPIIKTDAKSITTEAMIKANGKSTCKYDSKQTAADQIKNSVSESYKNDAFSKITSADLSKSSLNDGIDKFEKTCIVKEELKMKDDIIKNTDFNADSKLSMKETNGFSSSILSEKEMTSASDLGMKMTTSCSIDSAISSAMESKKKEFSTMSCEMLESKESFTSCDIKKTSETSSEFLSDLIVTELKMAAENL